MDQASEVALLTGFGGVLLGGSITFATEWIFRNKDQRAAVKRNLTLCLCEVGRVYSELVTVYNALVTDLGVGQPTMLSSHIRSIASSSIQPSNFDLIVLFAANHPDDEVFSDLELLFRRFNSNVATFAKINEAKDLFTIRQLQAGHMFPRGEHDIAEIEIDANDALSIAEMVRIENLYRGFFRNLISDIESSRSILGRLNKNSERKFGLFRWDKPPSVEVVAQFQPLEYLRDMPFFAAGDLPRVPAQ